MMSKTIILSTAISLKMHFIELGTCTLNLEGNEWVLVDELCILEISQ